MLFYNVFQQNGKKYATEKEFKNATSIADICVNHEIKILFMDT